MYCRKQTYSALPHAALSKHLPRVMRHFMTMLMILITAAVLFTAAELTAGADISHAASNFIIKDYDIDMTVNEDDTYDIHERIQVEFTAPSHGIYRTIPYRTTLDRDGQSSTFFAKVTDFKMISDQPFKLEKRRDRAFYRIGDAGKFADTNTTYELSYTYDTGGDHLKDADEVYHNLVGKDWEAKAIEHVSFRVTFPKDIDPANVGMKTGYQVDVPFESEGNRVIYGETSESTALGLTIRAVLPDNYFSRQAGQSNMLLYVLIGVLVVLALVGIVIWRKYGVDPPVVEPVEFYPPKGMTPAEVGYLKDGEIKDAHVTAMLLELADSGYVKIKETKTQSKFLKREITEYEIIKLKEYDGNRLGESTFMSGLFKGGSSTVKLTDLTDSFYKTVNKIKKAVQKRYENKLYDKTAQRYSGIMNLLGVLGLAALVIVSKIANQSPITMDGDLIINIVFMLMEIGLPALAFYCIASRVSAVKRKWTDILVIVAFLPVAAMGYGLARLFDTVMDFQVIPFLIGMAACFALFVLAALCERKSDYYTDILGKIRGYENFLKHAEKERMETLAEEDPEYFYHNLAFAFALGVTSVFASRFASLAQKPPEWYDSPDTYGPSTFSTTSMMTSLNSMMTKAGSTMTSSPSSSSGGGGGGSFSGGGGGGGGGGGSW